MSGPRKGRSQPGSPYSERSTKLRSPGAGEASDRHKRGNATPDGVAFLLISRYFGAAQHQLDSSYE